MGAVSAADVAYKGFIEPSWMAADFGSIVSADLMDKLLRNEIYRVCNATTHSMYNSVYPDWKKHDELVEICKSCNRDTAELERALSEAKSAMLHLRHVTDVETSCMRKAVDSKYLKPREEDLT
jgi:antirestriction protein